MPTLPKVSRTSLQAAKAGSLVSVDGPDKKVLIGLRVWVPIEKGDRVPGFVGFTRRSSGGFDARLWPATNWNPHTLVITGSTRIANHGDDWSFHVNAASWQPDFLVNFAVEHSGLLLAEEVDEGDQGRALTLAVTHSMGACQRLRFDTWTLEPPKTQLEFAVAREWEISLPGSGQELQLVFGKPPKSV